MKNRAIMIANTNRSAPETLARELIEQIHAALGD